MNLKNTIAIVTGGASGLGEATVQNIVEHGGKAVIFDLSAEKGQALAEKLGADNVIYVQGNVTNEEDVTGAGRFHSCRIGLGRSIRL